MLHRSLTDRQTLNVELLSSWEVLVTQFHLVGDPGGHLPELFHINTNVLKMIKSKKILLLLMFWLTSQLRSTPWLSPWLSPIITRGYYQYMGKIKSLKFKTVFVFVLAQLEGLPQKNFGFDGNFNGKMTKKIKWPKITFPGSKMVPKVSKWGF